MSKIPDYKQFLAEECGYADGNDMIAIELNGMDVCDAMRKYGELVRNITLKWAAANANLIDEISGEVISSLSDNVCEFVVNESSILSGINHPDLHI